MTFQPLLPSGGLAGWRYVTQTLDRQLDVFAKSPALQRDTEYFANTIASVGSAEDLVNDRRLLRVALGAFGLQDDINSRAFIQRILESDETDPASLANRASDERYVQLAQEFGFGRPDGPRVFDTAFSDRVIKRFRQSEFEVAIGNQDEEMRLALNARRELAELAARDSSDNTKWFIVLGTPPLRKVFETALNLPSSFAQIDLEQQVTELRGQLTRKLGIESVSDLSDDRSREKLLDRFFLQSQVKSLSSSISPQSIALSLLSAGLQR